MRAVPLQSLNYVVFDFETTGLDAKNGDEIIELGAVKIVAGQIKQEGFHSLVNPQREVPEEASRVHGITTKDLTHAPTIDEVLPKFLDFLGTGIVVAQNAKFDLGFLVVNLARLNIPRFDNQVLDTMLLSRFLFSYESRHNLDAIMQRLRIEPDDKQRHRSVGDCRMTAMVLLKMIDVAEKRGLANLHAVRSCLLKAGPIPIEQKENFSLF